MINVWIVLFLDMTIFFFLNHWVAEFNMRPHSIWSLMGRCTIHPWLIVKRSCSTNIILKDRGSLKGELTFHNFPTRILNGINICKFTKWPIYSTGSFSRQHSQHATFLLRVRNFSTSRDIRFVILILSHF